MEMTSSRITHIVYRVAEYYGVPVTAITGPSHAEIYVRARHVGMYLARELTGASLSRVGRVFGGRHHTTVSAACRRIEQCIRRGDLEIVADFTALREAEAQGKITRESKRALRRLRELSSIAEEIAGECRRLEGRLQAVGSRHGAGIQYVQFTPRPPRKCAWPGCEETFPPEPRNRKYCDKHSAIAARERDRKYHKERSGADR